MAFFLTTRATGNIWKPDQWAIVSLLRQLERPPAIQQFLADEDPDRRWVVRWVVADWRVVKVMISWSPVLTKK